MSIRLPQNSQRRAVFDKVQTFSEDEIQTPPQRSTPTKRTYIGILFAFLIVILASLHYYSLKYEQSNPQFAPVHQLGPQQIVDISHDGKCYTQGLSFINATHILESCGLYWQSYFQVLEYDADKQTTKEVYKSHLFDRKYFLEGSVYFPKTQFIYILTWKENVVFKIDPKTYEKVEEFQWFYEGWGLTHNNSHFIVSDGSNKLYVTDANFTIFELVTVTDNQNLPVNNLNELEWKVQNGRQYIYANVYQTDKIVKIDLLSGKVIEAHRFPQLTKKERESGHLEVLNGIAYHEKSNRFIITGKKWGNMYSMNYL